MRHSKHWRTLVARAVSEFQSLLAGLAGELEARIRRMVPTAVARLDQRELLAFITDAFPELVTPFLAASGDLTAVWYEDQLPGSDFRAAPADLAPVDQLAISGRWAMLQADPAAALRGTATRSLFNTSRETIAKNAKTEGVRWARHASANACGFCRMLAIRGADYSSEEAALAMRHTDDEGHDHCHCTAVPDRDGTYEPPAYYAQWKLDYKAALAAGAKTAGEIANAMDYMPGGRRYKGDDAPPHEVRKRPVNRDAPRPRPEPRQPEPVELDETQAEVAARLLPGLEKSLADLRAQGLPESSPQIQYHLAQIAKFRRQLKALTSANR